MKRIKFILFLSLSVFFGQAIAADMYVTQNGAGSKSGADWANAQNDLGKVLYDATPGTTVHVGAGDYKPSFDYSGNSNANPREKRFKFSGGVTILGGYPDGGGSEELRDPATNLTVLNGKIDDSNTVYTIAFGMLGAKDIVVDGFTFKNSTGRVTGPDDDYMNDFSGGAGAIIIMGGNTPNASTSAGTGMQLINCEFDGFTAKWGGALKLQRPEQTDNPKLTLDNCVFSNNVSGQNGGCVLAYSWDMDIKNTVFDNNDGGGSGGAIFCEGPGILKASNSVFKKGKVKSNGAGICCWATAEPWSTLIINECDFIENEGWDGVGVFSNSSADCLVTNSTFEKNLSSGGAGAIRLNGSFAIDGCLFEDNVINVAPGGWLDGHEGSVNNCIYINNRGGAGNDGVIFKAQINNFNVSNCYATGNAGKSIAGFAWGASGTMENVTLANNTGTAVAFQGATYTLHNVTISGNESPTNGAVINGSWEGNSAISVYDCTIVGNKSAAGQNALYLSGGTAVIDFDNCIYVGNGDEGMDYSSVFGSFSRTYSIWDDMLYGNGRFTILEEPFTIGKYLSDLTELKGQYVHSLLGGDNPAIGTGSPNSAGTRDQLGNLRGEYPCIGAVEYDPSSVNKIPASGLKVYPTIATSSIVVSNPFEAGVVHIFNANGMYIMTSDVTSGDNLLNIESLNAGVYFITLTNNKSTITTRFIKR